MANNYICALDIGSSKLSGAVARLKKNRIADIFLASHPAAGIQEGCIVDAIEAVACIAALLKNLKEKSGIKIKSLYANACGGGIVTKRTHAIIPLAQRGNKVITRMDLQKVNEQARILGSSLEEEIIHQIPVSYSIDSKSGIPNPLGLYSHQLEVDLCLVCVKMSVLQSLSRVINQTGYELKGLSLSGIATASAVFGAGQKTGLNVICDIGSDITELLIFADGRLKNMEVLSCGGNTLTQELSQKLNIPFDLAEELKRTHTSIGDYERIAPDKDILIKKQNTYKTIKNRAAAEIVDAKARLVSAKIKEALEKNVSAAQIDSFVLAGRAVLLEGFIEMLENTLGVPVRLGRLNHPNLSSFSRESELSGHKYLTYLTSLGIICHIQEDKQDFGAHPTQQPTRNPFLMALNRAKEVYQEYF